MDSGVLNDKIFKLPPQSAEDSAAVTPQNGDSDNPPSEMSRASWLKSSNNNNNSSNALQNGNMEGTPPVNSNNAPLMDSLCNQLQCDVLTCNIPTLNGATGTCPVLEVKRKCVKLVLILHLEERVPLAVLSVVWDRLCALTNSPELNGPQPWRLTLKFVRDCATVSYPHWKKLHQQRQQQRLRQLQQRQLVQRQWQPQQPPHNTLIRYYVHLLHGEVLPRATNIISVVYDVRMSFYQYTRVRPTQSSIHWVLECMEEKNGFLSRVNRDDALMNPHETLLLSPARVTMSPARVTMPSARMANVPVVDTPNASYVARAKSMDQTSILPRNDDRANGSDDPSENCIGVELASNKPTKISAQLMQLAPLMQSQVPQTEVAAGGAATILPTKRKSGAVRPCGPEQGSTRQPNKRTKLLEKGVGARVYGKWTYRKYSRWQWGIITHVSRYALGRQAFSIRFDDGHIVDDYGPRDFMTTTDFAQSPFGQAIVSDLIDLRRDACGTCAFCKKEDCTVCWTCQDDNPIKWVAQDNKALHNSSGGDDGDDSKRRPVCLRKICCNLDENRRKQPLPGFPVGWTYILEDPNSLVGLNNSGLAIVSPALGLKHWTIEDAKSRFADALEGVNLSALCRHLGVANEGELVGSWTTKKPAVKPNLAAPKAVRRLSNASKRALSTTKTIGSRVYCKWPENGTFYWGIITHVLQKRSAKYPRYTVEFDDGDIVEDIAEYFSRKALNIYTEAEYFESTNILPPPPPAHFLKRLKVHCQVDSINATYSPAELFERRCNTCSFCKSENCGRCETCRRRESGQNVREICLRKMCLSIEMEKKAQPAAGLEDGWRFVFGDFKARVEEKRYQGSLPGLRILSPAGRLFSSLEQVLDTCGKKWKDWDTIRESFCLKLGMSILRSDKSHFLVGKRYCQEWTDLDGLNKIVHGTVTDCERMEMDDTFYQFTVVYDERSRKFVNSVRNRCGSYVPEKANLSLAWTLGGCFHFDQKCNICLGKPSTFASIAKAEIPNYWSWITPEMRIEDLIPHGGNMVPQLTMTTRGFQLTFTARVSTIPNAGYGVFVKCFSFTGEDTFRLNPGEVLDIGVYAPFRKEDRKNATVFLLKNYIHNLKCEEWAFDTADPGFQFDITDDATGAIHELAKSHIPAYVNECGPNAMASVKAEHDPEGNVHYLLGTADGSSSFSLPADESEHEIFINYGPAYEHVRVRKGYSSLPAEELAKQQLKAKNEDAEYICEMNEFEKDDVSHGLDFVGSLFQTVPICTDKEAILRALTATAVLQNRAERLGEDTMREMAENLLCRILPLLEDHRLAQLKTFPNFCYVLVKDQLKGAESAATLSLLSTLLE